VRKWIWTIRLEGRPEPFLWVVHEGNESVRFVERTVAQATARGETVIVNLTRTTRQRPVVEVIHG
jgi:hypothetical protein